MITTFNFRPDEAWNDLPLNQAFAYQATHLEQNPYLDRVAEGYIAQEAQRQ